MSLRKYLLLRLLNKNVATGYAIGRYLSTKNKPKWRISSFLIWYVRLTVGLAVLFILYKILSKIF